jgi:hypothetical protein
MDWDILSITMKKVFPTVFFLFLLASCQFLQKPSAEEVHAITGRVQNSQQPAFVKGDQESLKRWKAVAGLYESRGFQPIDLDRSRPRAAQR